MTVPDLSNNPLCLFVAVPVIRGEHLSVQIVSSVHQFHMLRCLFDPGVKLLRHPISYFAGNKSKESGASLDNFDLIAIIDKRYFIPEI